MTTKPKFRKPKLPFGPAILVTAAFIGPGTVMMAIGAGAKYGYALLWAVAFSAVATIILQEMAARLGIVTGHGLSHAIRASFSNPTLRFAALALVLTAVLIGNAAYQTGNILGATQGVMAMQPQDLQENEPQTNGDGTSSAEFAIDDARQKTAARFDRFLTQNNLVLLVGVVALLVIWIGHFELLQLILMLLVGLMSLLFVVSALMGSPDWQAIGAGFVPRIPKGDEWFVIGLIGTTVVPYNLFLHANAAAQRWSADGPDPSEDAIRKSISSSRWDTIVSVTLGGCVTGCILITAAVAFHSNEAGGLATFRNVKDVAIQLKPLGEWSQFMFALGLLAAGLTSAITAPIAAGYAAAGCFGWPGKLSDWRLKMTATSVVVVGVVCAIQLGKSPIEAIILAQVANGLLLPVVASFLLVMVNRVELMKQYRNRVLTNVVGVVVILIVSLIAFKNLNSAKGKIEKLLYPDTETSVSSVEANRRTNLSCKPG